MKLGTLKRISKDDIVKAAGGEELPKWIDAFLDPLNQAIEKFAVALGGKLTFDDNFSSKISKIEFTHDVEQAINPFPIGAKSLRVVGVFPISSGSQMIDGFKWVSKSDGSIGVTFQFTGGTSATKAICSIIILLG